MRVRSISVRKLFGRFDHVIPLNLDERVTIIHGPNGYGKTALLRLVDAAFRFDVTTLLGIPFEKLRADLDDGSYLEVAPDPDRAGVAYVFGIGDRDMARESFYDTPFARRRSDAFQERYERTRQESSEVSSAVELLDILQRKEPAHWSGLFLRLWLSRIPVVHVSVRRLFTPTRLKPYQSHLLRENKEEGEALTFDETVVLYPEELRESILEAQADYTTEIQSLDRTFPKRLMEAMNEPVPAHADLASKLRDLDARRQWLASLGILPSEDARTEVPASITDDATRKLLWLYARDVETKLDVFEGFANHVGLLQELINQRFEFKRLKIDADRGLMFESDTGQALPPTTLSSGEQHLLVMIYECLFATPENALLLIDEPELSLHVSWQVEFLRDLQRMIEIAKFDVLIATHSPQIIHDRWDLTVELQPPSEPPVPVAADVSLTEDEAGLE